MHTARVIQAIQEIKDSVEKPYSCGWFLQLPQINQVKRYRTGRYIDGAVKIMDILRDEVNTEDIVGYQQRYDYACECPRVWVDERLDAAKDLWKYVLSLDERVSHQRIMSAGAAASGCLIADNSSRSRRIQVRGSIDPERKPPANDTSCVSCWWSAPGGQVPALVPTFYYGWNWAYVTTSACLCELYQGRGV